MCKLDIELPILHHYNHHSQIYIDKIIFAFEFTLPLAPCPTKYDVCIHVLSLMVVQLCFQRRYIVYHYTVGLWYASDFWFPFLFVYISGGGFYVDDILSLKSLLADYRFQLFSYGTLLPGTSRFFPPIYFIITDISFQNSKNKNVYLNTREEKKRLHDIHV